MNQQLLNDISKYVEDHIGEFHAEIEHIGQLFDDYKKIKLEIWRTFTDTTIEKILAISGQ